MVNLQALVRPNIKNLQPYSSARDEFHGPAAIFLDANENSLGSTLDKPLNRYPDPRQKALKERISQIKNIQRERIFLGNGSDEAIDLLIRAFCEPGRDHILIMPPTYGMYRVCAEINNVAVEEVPLRPGFQMDVQQVLQQLRPSTRLVFICSPNNPSGNLLSRPDVQTILDQTRGLVVVDEAYIDFCPQDSLMPLLKDYPHLILLQTLSKAWGLAALRLGMAFADPFIIEILNKIKPPYNINGMTQQLALQALDQIDSQQDMVARIIAQRRCLEEEFKNLPMVETIYPSAANFLLVRFKQSDKVFRRLKEAGIIVRDRSKALHCHNCLRITVGTETENQILIKTLKSMEQDL